MFFENCPICRGSSVVERRPEEAGVVGSIPTLDTIYLLFYFSMQSIDKAWVIENGRTVVMALPSELLQDLFQREPVVFNVLMLGTERVVNKFCGSGDNVYCKSPRECTAAGKCLA